MSVEFSPNSAMIILSMHIIRHVIIVLVCATPFSGFADQFETKRMFAKGHWSVELTHNTSSGLLWCDAQTSNRRGQTLSITGYDSGGLALFIFDNRWSISERPVRFILDIDYSRWTVDGNARDSSVSFAFDDIDKTSKFLRELQQGSAVALYNDEMRRLATFSLRGSSAAITSLFDCWSSITSRDPFTDASDPFSRENSADPFY